MSPLSASSILVVDDTVENLRLLSSILGEQGYEVRPVTSGRQALQAAELDPPEIVLLDITMPEMDGFAVCERFKASDKLRDIPIIFITALSDTADKVRAFNVGGADYITKPFKVEEVLARVRVHVALRQAQRELQHSFDRLQTLEKLREDLVHMVVHDMRSPLTVLMAHLGFLETDVSAALGQQACDDIAAALQAARMVNRMANDLLDVSRLEEKKMPLDRKTHDAVVVAAAVGAALTGLDRTRTIQVDASGPVEASFDRGIVQRVLENLVNNAIKHTPAGGRIRIGVSALDSHIRIAVQDEGPGVPVEARARIFERFETAGTRKDGSYHSVGLGLAFCKLAVEAHGGTIGVESAVPVGSVFWFQLPASPPPATASV